MNVLNDLGWEMYAGFLNGIYWSVVFATFVCFASVNILILSIFNFLTRIFLQRGK